MSSEGGDLLFYCDGVTVYDAMDLEMPNGMGLGGATSSAQSAIAVPVPNDPDKYYLFSQSGEFSTEVATTGLKYSMIDMSLAGNGTISNPMGDVTDQKNISLVLDTQESLAVSPDESGGYWVVAYKEGPGNGFYSYHIDGTTGLLNTVPVISGDGGERRGNFISSIKFNPCSYQLTRVELDASRTGLEGIELWAFDNTIGVVETPKVLNIHNAKPYGVEYSPNGVYIYVTCN